MSNPQLEDGFVRIANEIWNEVIRRDFSKRQLNIMFFIWRLSYGCNKKTAIIQKLKDFEICGVGQQNIKKELKYLSDCNVIFIQNEIEYSVNKRIKEWQISPIKGWDQERFKEILSQNIEKNFSKQEVRTSQNEKITLENTSQNKKFSEAKDSETSQNENRKLLKTRSSDFSKQEVLDGANARGSKGEGVSKDIIKDIIKDNNKESTTTTTSENPFRIFEAEGFGTISSFIAERINGFINDYGERWTCEAMREAVFYGKRNLSYVQAILERWRTSGIDEPWKAEKSEENKNNVKQFNRSQSKQSNKPKPVMYIPDEADTEMSEEEMRELQEMIRMLDGSGG